MSFGNHRKLVHVTSRLDVGFGQWIKKQREKARVPQGELAARVGITQAHMSRVETGAREASANLVILLASELGLDRDEALGVAGFPTAAVQAMSQEGLTRSEDLDNLMRTFAELSTEDREVLIGIAKTMAKQRKATKAGAGARFLKKA